jgi:hypothetical protein
LELTNFVLHGITVTEGKPKEQYFDVLPDVMKYESENVCDKVLSVLT